MLELTSVTAGYGAFTALWDVSLRVATSEAVAVVGPNGAGKTTLLRVISGLIAPRAGTLTFEGAPIGGRPAYEIVGHGIAHVPEGRRIFPALTVADNLKMGAFLPAARKRFAERLARVYALFPVLAERQKQRAGSLSGGEQQMLAVGRALMSGPKLILLDEPSMGLAPVMVLRLFDLIRRVREETGLANVQVMVPFVRTVDEGRRVVELLARHGLERGRDGLKVIMMCEVPSNALLADDFLDMFDGFSIGSNDLTQLTLGLDRDSGIVAGLFDERDPAVKKLLSMAIKAARAKGKYIGICGQGPSDHPDLAEWLMDQGIESVSLNPDTVVDTWLRLAKHRAG